MYVQQGVFGTVGSADYPLSNLRRQFPWISPGEVLADGAVSYSVLRQYNGGVTLALYDRGGIMVDSQDFFRTPTPVAGLGAAPAGVEHGALFGARAGIFGPMGAPATPRSPTPGSGMGLFPTLPGQPNWGLFSPREGVFGPMGARPRGTAPPGYALSGELFPTLPGQPNWGMFSPHAGIFGPMGARPRGQAPEGYALRGMGASAIEREGATRQGYTYSRRMAPGAALRWSGLRGLGDADTPTEISVTVVQRGLVSAGTQPSPGTVDGLWGPNTYESLRSFIAQVAPGLGLDAARALAPAGGVALRDVPARNRAVTLPNAVASRLESLSGSYRAPSSSSSSSSSSAATTPSGASTGKNGGALPASADEASYLDELLPSGGFDISMPVLGAPLWVWLLAGGLVAAGGGYYAYARTRRRRTGRAQVEARRASLRGRAAAQKRALAR
jgi:hypothetical protein